MRAAIYARKSTDEHQAASLDVQLGEATTYIDRKGWTLDPEHVFIEEPVSRAEYAKRYKLGEMLLRAERGEFDVLVVRDETRLGGEMLQAGIVVQRLVTHGVAIWYYFENKQVRLDNATDKLLLSVANYTAEVEREKTSARTREHLMVKARKGLNAGGRVFGYDNIRTGNQVEYWINEDQAALVRRIFRLYADGNGFKAIAIQLNDEGVLPPRVGKRGTGSWGPNTIRAMLNNERYRGVLTWGRYRKGYKTTAAGSTKVRERQPDCEVITVEAPHLRIVDDELWIAVHERMEANRRRYSGSRGPKGSKPASMLSGLARCSECGGPIWAQRMKHGDRVVQLYACSYNRTRGRAVCTNTVRRPVDAVNDAIIAWLRTHVLKEELVAEVVAELRLRLKARTKDSGAEATKLEAQVSKLKTEIGNLAEGLATLGHSAVITDKIRDRTASLERVQTQLNALQIAPSAIDLEARRLEQEARSRLGELRQLLDGNPVEARRVVEALTDGPLTFRPVRDEGGPAFVVEGRVCSLVNVPKGI